MNDSISSFVVVVKVSALNEAVPGSVKSVFKAWEQRLSISEVSLASRIIRVHVFCGHVNFFLCGVLAYDSSIFCCSVGAYD